MELHPHPAADSFPMMDSNRYTELVANIAEHGQLEPITLYDGMILDGRNRYKACLEIGIEPKTRQYEGDPWAYVWSLNGERRDLVAEQRYLIWKLCHEQSEAFQSEKRRIQEEANRKRAEAAREQENRGNQYMPKVEVREHIVHIPAKSEQPERKAKAAASKTNPGAVARGDKLVKERPDLADQVRKGKIKPAEAHRLMKKDEVAKKTEELPDDKYIVIYADPPWSYNDKQSGSISESYGAADKHYPTMTLSELKSLPINNLAADNSVLFLWSTAPLIEDALELCRAWGFKYKAQFIWDKVNHNMGHYNSVRHELLLVCTKGSCTPQKVKLYDSVQVIEKTKEHSRKPEEFRAIIDDIYPHGNRIELFNRDGAPGGWVVWGNQSK